MKNYKEVIEKNVKDSSFYLPIIDVLDKSQNPLSIKEMAKILNITYGAAKPRLHKLEKWNLIQRLKRGYYWLPHYCGDLTQIPKSKGEIFFLNGCIRIMGQGNGVWITIYNSKFGEKNNGDYCIIENFENDKCILRKNNKFRGNKLYFLKSKSVGMSVPRREISSNVLSNLSTKVIPIKIGIYPKEWDISVGELFSTESKEDGELAEELNKIGEVKKPSKFENLKADIIFNYQNKKIPIEVTTISISQTSNHPQHRMSSIKASQIIMRLYFSIKWNYLHGLSTILVIHKDWNKQKWIKEEEKFMRNFNCYILFTDFDNGWAYKSALEIKRLIESSRFNKKTLLNSS
ncbi:MAG: winged helix-turn-helix domain-containing protein [bacterium]